MVFFSWWLHLSSLQLTEESARWRLCRRARALPLAIAAAGASSLSSLPTAELARADGGVCGGRLATTVVVARRLPPWSGMAVETAAARNKRLGFEFDARRLSSVALQYETAASGLRWLPSLSHVGRRHLQRSCVAQCFEAFSLFFFYIMFKKMT